MYCNNLLATCLACIDVSKQVTADVVSNMTQVRNKWRIVWDRQVAGFTVLI